MITKTEPFYGEDANNCAGPANEPEERCCDKIEDCLICTMYLLRYSYLHAIVKQSACMRAKSSSIAKIYNR